MGNHFMIWLAVCLLQLGWANQTWAERYALLVGVSGYPQGSGIDPLPGARNDIELMKGVLARKRFEADKITILADGIGGAPVPTRANILSTLDALVAKTTKGDFIYLHFSGHGAQQPAINLPKDADPEPDDKSEIFLPIDVGKWNDDKATVDHAIVDHELVSRLRQLTDRGAFVWSVIDACHSASLVRGGDTVTFRGVSPQTLGIPAEAWARARKISGSTRGSVEVDRDGLGLPLRQSTGESAYVSFYAAQPWERAPEMLMPRGSSATDTTARPYGVLTYTLAEALSSLEGVTYRQLGDYILQRYAVQALGERPTPVYSGSRLEVPVFGQAGTGTPPILQWPVKVEDGKVLVMAGVLSELTEGTGLIIVPTPVAEDRAATANAEVIHADPFQAELRLSAVSPSTPLVMPAARDAVYARLVRPSLSYRLRVAKPKHIEGKTANRVMVAVNSLAVNPGAAPRIDWVTGRAAAELALYIEGECLWFLPPSGELNKSGECGGAAGTPSMRIPSSLNETRQAIADRLATVSKSKVLLKAVETAQALSQRAPLRVEFQYIPKGGSEQPMPSGALPRVRDGDVITIRLRNPSNEPIDASVIYIDATYGISAEFPKAGDDNRVEPGAVFDSAARFANQKGIEISDLTAGIEHILVLAEPASKVSKKDYRYLAQEGIGPAPGVRAAGGSELGEFLNQALWPSDTVGGARRSHAAGVGDGVARMLSFEVVKSDAT
jgi:hypothetical protein